MAGRGLCYPRSQKRGLEHPPAHRDNKAAMNEAQFFKIQSDSSELMNEPPADYSKLRVRRYTINAKIAQ